MIWNKFHKKLQRGYCPSTHIWIFICQKDMKNYNGDSFLSRLQSYVYSYNFTGNSFESIWLAQMNSAYSNLHIWYLRFDKILTFANLHFFHVQVFAVMKNMDFLFVRKITNRIPRREGLVNTDDFSIFNAAYLIC